MALRYLFLLQAALYEKWTDSFHSTAERTGNCPGCQSSSYLKENKNMGKKIRSVRPWRRNGTSENIHLARGFLQKYAAKSKWQTCRLMPSRLPLGTFLLALTARGFTLALEQTTLKL